jgi:hypothetical protein
MKISLTVQDIRNLKKKFDKHPQLAELVEIVELIFLRVEKNDVAELKSEIEELKKELKKAQRNWSIELNRVSLRIK